MKKIPKELEALKLHDGRPAYLFVDRATGKLPLKEFSCDKKTCPYCGEEIKQDSCSCYSYKKAKEYNKSLERE